MCWRASYAACTAYTCMMARTSIPPWGGSGRRIRTSDHRIDREDSPLKTLRFTIHAWLVPLAIGLAMLASGNADAATLENIEGQGMDRRYGTYVPRGDCKREQSVTVDDSGYAQAYDGKSNQRHNIAGQLPFTRTSSQGTGSRK